MDQATVQTMTDREARWARRQEILDLVGEAACLLRFSTGTWMVTTQQDRLVDAIEADEARRERLRAALTTAEEARQRFLAAAVVVERELTGR